MKRNLRILYIGELREGGTCLERMRVLQRMGHHVVSMDKTPWLAGNARLFRSLAHRVDTGPVVWQLNKALRKNSDKQGAVDLVWVDKGRHIYPETLAHVREKTGARLVHYTPDPQLLHHKSRHFRACIPLYDLVVTTKPFELDLYREMGARQVMLVLQGFDGRFAPRVPTARDRDIFGSDVAFIGHCERHYTKCLKATRRVATRLRIWGDEWPRYAQFHRWARVHVAGGGIWGEDYPRALACTKIALGLLSKRIPETTTTRTFEIPAMGVFMLAERTDDHLALFREGIEAEFFGSDDELREKIGFYLSHDNARRKIAAAGRERCVQSGYDAASQIEKVLTRLTKLGS